MIQVNYSQLVSALDWKYFGSKVKLQPVKTELGNQSTLHEWEMLAETSRSELSQVDTCRLSLGSTGPFM